MSERPSAWAAGWSTFAAVMLIFGGCFQAIAGLVALVNDEFWVIGEEWVFQFDATTWGWIHLLLGLVLVLSGIGVMSGNLAARTVGVIIALISGVVAFAWLPWYPVWAILIIAVDASVIWALTAHGRDVAEV